MRAAPMAAICAAVAAKMRNEDDDDALPRAIEALAQSSSKKRERDEQVAVIVDAQPKRVMLNGIGKAKTRAELEYQLAVLEIKYEHDRFRIGAKGRLERLTGGQWKGICHHSKTGICHPCDMENKYLAGEPIIIETPMPNADIDYLQEHFRHRKFRISLVTGRVMMLMGKKWVVVCGHGRRPELCRPCDGRALCIEHDAQGCVQCHPELTCECGRVRRNCPKHGRKGICHVTRKRKAECVHCKGCRVCPRCTKRLIKRDGTCYRCHDNFIPTPHHCSREACRFIDQLEKYQGIKYQHNHFDPQSNSWISEEYQLKDWPTKRVDGYNKDGNIIVEYLGGDVHGHPARWEFDHDRIDRNGNSMQSNYFDTSVKMSKLKGLGYRVLYVWSADVNVNTGVSHLPGFYREFTEHLEWE